MGAMSCSNCGVDFGKFGPAPTGPDLPSADAAAPTAQGGWQLPPEFDPSWSRRPWLRRHWRVVIVLALVGFIIAIYAFLFFVVFQMAAVPTQRINSDLSEASGGEILSVLPEPAVIAGGRMRFILFVADNVSPAEAERLACTVVPRVLAQDGYAGTAFQLSRVGANDLADSTMLCP